MFSGIMLGEEEINSAELFYRQYTFSQTICKGKNLPSPVHFSNMDCWGQGGFLFMENKNINFSKGEKRREELQLPVLHFIAADDWMDKLGNDAFCAWLKLYTWCDRSSNRNDKENDVIPTSFKKVMERLNVGRKKFYNSIIRPLWNYGLIDIMEYNKSNSDGQKPMNIIVYEYPQNDITKKYEPLEQIRNYDTDYSSASRTFAQKGGRKKSNIS